MTKKHRFHILFALHYLRYGLLLCLIPMVRALLAWDFDSLLTALWQDLYILIFCAIAALCLWASTLFEITPNGIFTQQGIFLQSRRVFRGDSIAALEITRPLHCRLLGASKLTLYFKALALPRTYQLYLPQKTAAAVAEALLPVRSDTNVFAPTGFERLAFVMLSANVITSWVFIVLGVKQVTQILGDGIQEVAKENFTRLTAFAAHFLPAGAAIISAAVFVMISATFFYTLLHTAGFRVCRNGGVIIMRGGFITKIERRISVQSISACDVRVTPVARLLRRYPLYISAGSFRGGDIPLMVYRKNAAHLPETLLPHFTPPNGTLCEPKRKSIVQYVWLPCTCLALCLALCGVAFAVMPSMLPFLAVPALFSLGSVLQSYEGFLKEGMCKNENRSLSLVFTRFFTRHEVCIFSPDVSYTMLENPLSLSAGRCDFCVSLPCRLSYKARGVLRYQADRIPFIL